MGFLVPSQGDVQLLQYMLNFTPANNVVLHLYNNNYTPASTDTVSNYTESMVAGYSPVTLTGNQWTISTVLGTTSASFAQQTFTFGAAENLYGLFATNNASSVLLWAERFTNAPLIIQSSGGSIDIDPQISLMSN